ncbi:MAG: protein kinase [Chloroflexota bacterium]|nr:protein kinase [Chloroflexota bacterium]
MARPRQPFKAAAPAPSGDATELKNYNLRERIGQDELAVIYRAQHQTLDRDVHVHILRRPGWVAISRFQLAAKLAARLAHPHLLPVLDAGHDEHYGYYLVTPPVDARPLQELVDAGPVDPPLALRIFAQIGQALDFLHKEGVIHRDVQPQTILVTPDGKALLTGLSLAWTADGPDLSQLDEADYLTPYAAPEQTFEDRTPTPALDIYALGAVLQHMLTGELPSSTGAELPSVGTRDPRLAPADKIIRRMLSPQPHLRYTTAAQAAAALRGVLRPVLGEVIGGAPPGEAPAEASWLENPLEIVLRDRIDADFLQRTLQRSERLHGGEGIRRLLDAWSSGQPHRRRQLGQAIRIEQVVSYNLYFYDLKVLYETRSLPETRERPYKGSKLSSREQEPDRWQVDVPVPDEPFADVPAQEVRLPYSDRSLVCPRCQGETRVTCGRCAGRGTLEVKRTVKTAAGSHSEVEVVDCAECGGAALVTCGRCDGTGGLMEHKVFTFSRRGRLWQNTDDLEGLPPRTIESRSEQVFSGEVEVHDPVWHAVQPLHELFAEATRLENDETRIVAAELTIRGTPVTEVDYTLRDKARTLAVIGFDDDVRGDLSLFDTERIMFAAAIAVIVVLAVVLYLALRS